MPHIPFDGEEYAPDIEKRIARGIKKHSQETLRRFVK